MQHFYLHCLAVLGLSCLLFACSSSEQPADAAKGPTVATFNGAPGEVKIMTLDPGHFHAALVQKFMYAQVDSTVHVFAPEGEDVALHLKRIEGFNTRAEQPTQWKEEVYYGADFFEKMLEQRPGNVMVVAGNNSKKTEYIFKAVQAGIHVLADKPMVIKPEGLPLLYQAFDSAAAKGVFLYDIMTERFEISTILQKELALFPEVFGQLEMGTPDNPAITKESVHHFFKYVSGAPLKRPMWFYDVEQQGEGIVDVSTHLVDLILWECFPEQPIEYQQETEVLTAKRWTTAITPTQFKLSTGSEQYPDYLQKDVKDSLLNVYSNGEFVFLVRGVHAKVSVVWNFQAPEGAGDTHFSQMRGTKASLIIRQDKAQEYKPTLYVEAVKKQEAKQIEAGLAKAIEQLQAKYAGIGFKPAKNGWEITVPDSFKVGHEAHFSQVTENYLRYLAQGKIPEWEVQNTKAKYYITMQAYQKSR